MTTKDFVNLVCDRIVEGKLDKFLGTIMAECNARRSVLRDHQMRRNMRDLNQAGNKVRIAGNIRPKYLLGHEGTVVERPDEFRREKPGTIYIDLGERVGTARRRFGPVVGIPASCLEAV